jgi:hypothetical protein
MPLTSFNIDERTDRTLEELKTHYGASSKAEVVRKAIALLNVAKAAEQPDGSVVIMRGADQVRVIVK